MNGYELRHHLADEHGIHLTGMSYPRLVDIHRGEHWPDASRPNPDHGHEDEDGTQESSMAPPGSRPQVQVRRDSDGSPQ